MSDFQGTGSGNFAASLGGLIYRWNWLEQQVVSIAAHLMGGGGRTAVAGAELGRHRCADVLRSLAVDLLPNDTQQVLKTYLDYVRRLGEHRNYYAHGIVGIYGRAIPGSTTISHTEGLVQYQSASGGYGMIRDHVPADRIDVISAEIDAVCSFGQAVFTLVMWDMRPSGERPSPPVPPPEPSKLVKPRFATGYLLGRIAGTSE